MSLIFREEKRSPAEARAVDQPGLGRVELSLSRVEPRLQPVTGTSRELDSLESVGLGALRVEQPPAGLRVGGERAHEWTSLDRSSLPCARPARATIQHPSNIHSMMVQNGLMAGGMRRGLGIPLRDRQVVIPGMPPRQPRVRHCWVEGPADCPGPWPGVVVQWRRDPTTGSWSALVVYVVTEGTSSTTVQCWLSANLLTPALPT